MDFWNGVGRKLTRAAKSVAGLVRDEVEQKKQPPAAAEETRRELERCLAEIGRAYCASLNGGGPVPEALLEEVRAREERLGLQTELLKWEQPQRCPACGAAARDPGARFCALCGRPLPEEAPAAAEEPAEEIEYCRSCGAARRDGEKVCPLCGASFEPGADLPRLDPEAPAPAVPPEDILEEPEDERRYDE